MNSKRVITKGNCEMICFLLRVKTIPIISNPKSQKLEIAIISQNLDLVQKYPGDPKSGFFVDLDFALSYACRSGTVGIVRYFTQDLNVDPSAHDNEKRTSRNLL